MLSVFLLPISYFLHPTITMAYVDDIFDGIRKQIYEDVQPGVLAMLVDNRNDESESLLESNITEEKLPTFSFLLNIFKEIDTLRSILENDDTILVSVRNQKCLRTAFQLIVSLGLSPCLIPGLGLSLSKRCTAGSLLPPMVLTDEQKYQILVSCTDFFTRCYSVPVLKNIIITLHLSDYLAALIQLAFAPLKKPGTYTNFTMTQEMYNQYQTDRKKYIKVYENLVTNCFQPILMKELLVLQSVMDPSPPVFVKRVIQKEMSRRLLAPGGLLSLIRCFIDNSATDTGLEWKKIDMICRLVSAQHGTDSLDIYLMNICKQLTQILIMNNTHYLATAVACTLSLKEKYSQSEVVQSVIDEIFQCLDYSRLVQSDLPGVVILSPQEVSHHINVLHSCVCSTKVECPVNLSTPSLYTLFLLGMKCTKNEEMNLKIETTLLKCFEKLYKSSMLAIMKDFLFGKVITAKADVFVEEYDAGLAIKCQTTPEKYPKSEAVSYLFKLYMKATENVLVENMFEAALTILIELCEKKNHISKTSDILKVKDNDVTLNEINEDYSNILQLLSEMSETPKVVNTLKSKPVIVLDFIEYFLTKTQGQGECITMALVLLNTILSNSKKIKDLETRLTNLIPVLENGAKNDSEFNRILYKEALSLIRNESQQKVESKCDKAISEVFNHLLPVRAHGIIDLTKLIEQKDAETISKKHYLFCLFQEQLKDPDSYVYLAAINGVAALGTHCTDDVIQVLCKEFLQVSTYHQDVLTNQGQRLITELRMKIGDVIVKVTRNLGEMAIVHKTVLLNTMLCGCRDEEPFIRMSALSNLAEIVRVLNYKIGSIIYEVLLCIWSILEHDKAVECRRAAVMVITSLLKGLGKETLVQLKENLLPIYRALKKLHGDQNEDSIVRLHAQLALEELNDTVREFLFPELKVEKQIYVLDKPEDVFK